MSFDVTSREVVTTQTVETMADQSEKSRVHVGALLEVKVRRLLTRPNGMANEGPVLRLPVGTKVLVVELLCEQQERNCPCGARLLTDKGLTFCLTEHLREVIDE